MSCCGTNSPACCGAAMMSQNLSSQSTRMRRRRQPVVTQHHQPTNNNCGHHHDDGLEHDGGVTYSIENELHNARRHSKRDNMRRGRGLWRQSSIFTLQILLLLCCSTASVFARASGNTLIDTALFIPSPISFLSRNQHHTTTLSTRASLFVSIQHPSSNVASRSNKSGVKDMSSYFSHNRKPNNHDDYDPEQPLTLQPKALLQKLSSFSSNISRLRLAKKRNPKSKSKDDALIGACTSLVHFFRDETVKLSSSTNTCDLKMDGTTIESLQQMIEMTMVQSIRASSEVGDFIVLTKLVHGVVDYATAIINYKATGDQTEHIPSNTGSSSMGLLSPRIFGEAFTSLSKTKASTSKLKSLWKYFINDVVSSEQQSVLSLPPSAYELNAMLSALGDDRGKIGAAIKLYRETVGEKEVIEGDAYTASILFGLLTDSIPSNKGFTVAVDKSAVQESGSDKKDAGGELHLSSSCWQWNMAMEILDTLKPSQLNNYAYAALLKVNERATEEFIDASGSRAQRHDGVRCAMSVLQRMKKDEISPDVITCSTLLTTFDKCRNWKASVTLLNAMQASSSSSSKSSSGESKWSLPSPNTYIYSSVISTCARCNQGELALSLLGNMITETDSAESPNTWVYNAALLACCTEESKKSKGGAANLVTAFDILEKMENLGSSPPDTVSYNTVLSVLDESSFVALKESGTATYCRLSKHDRISDVVQDILDTMVASGVARDAITYYNAILACRGSSSNDDENSSSSEDALVILRSALLDADFIQTTTQQQHLKGRASTGTLFVANAALSVIASNGDVHAVPEVLSMLSEANNTKLDAESIKHIILTLGKINDCEAILALLICLRGQDFANDILKERYSIDILSNLSKRQLPMIEEGIYSAAITSCLRHDELGMADQILLSMKKNGLALNQRSLKEIIAEYCRMAMSSSKDEFKIARHAKKHDAYTQQHNGSMMVEPIYITSRARAKAALTMLRAVEKPLLSPSLLSSIAKACCAAGLWQDARSVLRRMHRAAISELRLIQNGNNNDSSSSSVRSVVKRGEFLDELPRLHRSLLKFCAKGGNITPALNFADDVQFLAAQIRRQSQHGKQRGNIVKKEPELITLSSRLLMDIPTPENIPEADFSNAGALSSILDRPIGLTGQDWKLILIAASRGGHWKVCVGTLPFIRPYVKETHPMYARESYIASTSSSSTANNDLGGPAYGTTTTRPSLERLNRKYDRIARALTAAILCFEARSQYAWAIRAIDDWIEWSGRRPRKEAVASACRILAKRYRGQEVLTLVTKVMSVPAIINLGCLSGDESEAEGVATADYDEYTYETAIYTESINALHKSGLYEEADQLYAAGVSDGHLPWAVMQSNMDDSNKQLRLDLHGMSAAVAHSAVRVSLQKEIMGSSSHNDDAVNNNNISWSRDVMIITGRGRRSGERFKPVLRPEVQRMLTEEFYPPLGTSSIPGNMGALLIPSGDIKAWLDHQRTQKGERLLFVAGMLRGISSGNRIESAISRSTSRLERALMMKFQAKEEGNADDTGLVVDDDDVEK